MEFIGDLFHKKVKNITKSFYKGVKAVQEYKPQGINSHKTVKYIGISTYRGFIRVKDLLKQKIY